MPASDPILASVDLWPHPSRIPRGWTLCNGQLLSIQQNSALYSLLGVTYGGDGVNTFGVPNLCGRVAVGAGQSNPPTVLKKYNPGETGGCEQVTINQAQMPVHNHNTSVTITTKAGTGKISLVSDPTNNFPGQTPDTMPIYTSASNANMGSSTVTVNNPTAGGSQPFPVVQPYLGMYYVIALEGIYPSWD